MQKSKIKKQIVRGVINTKRNGSGIFYVDGSDEMVEIESGFLNTALNKDKVEVCVHPHKKGSNEKYGEVVRIIKRAREKFVATIETDNGLYFAVPDDNKMYTDIYITNPPKNIKNGQKVVVLMKNWTDPAKDPIGEIVEILGEKGEHEVEIKAITLEYNIGQAFPKEVLKKAEEIKAKALKELKEPPKNRKDIRRVPTITIDPEDAKDFDDAISLEKKKNGDYLVGIHIADVSHYVKEGSLMDKEAKERGFSSYLVDRTIPMLPPALSENICSLNPREDRNAFSAIFTMDKTGKVKERWFGKTLIHSDKRFTYKEAQDVIDNKEESNFKGMLRTLNDIAKKLREKRFEEGSIDFKDSEIKVELDKNGHPMKIYRKERLPTHMLIEELMLMANKEVANIVWEDHKARNGAGKFLYRTHDLPDKEKLSSIIKIINGFGYNFSPIKITAKKINAILELLATHPANSLIHQAMIRSMAKATYTTNNIGHFGLGFKRYTHFTSPIRRYADLLVHRLLYRHILGRHITDQETKKLKTAADELSEREITIAKAERESISLKQTEYMADKIGQKFSGIITGVVNWGIYIEEKATGAEGLVHIKNLPDDYYILNEKNHQLVGKNTGKKYTLGDKINFSVKSVNTDRKTIDFELR